MPLVWNCHTATNGPASVPTMKIESPGKYIFIGLLPTPFSTNKLNSLRKFLLAASNRATKPVALSSDLECCSFSGRIPGVVDRISKIFREDRLPGLETIEVQDEEALSTARELLRRGLPVGPSSGLNYRAAIEVARRLGKGAIVATVFPDRMERYFTTDLFRPYR